MMVELRPEAGPLSGKVAVVTGGASGVGAAFVRGLADTGASVWIADIRSPQAEKLPAGRTSASRVVERHCDVSDPQHIIDFVEHVKQVEGRIDILINNAGVMRTSGPLDEWKRSLEDFEHLINVNLRGPFLFGRAIIPEMVENGGGHIIMLSTDHVHTCGWPHEVPHESDSLCPWSDAPRPTGAVGMDIYDASKWALHGLTQDWAKELREHGVRVNNVCLGATDSGMIREYAGYGDTEPPAEVIDSWQAPDSVAAVVVDLILEGDHGRSGDNIGLWRGHPTVLPPPDPVLNVSRRRLTQE